MKYTVSTMTEVVFYGTTLTIPNDVVKKGEAAMVKWCNDNIRTVDNAPISHSEICITRKVTGISIER